MWRARDADGRSQAVVGVGIEVRAEALVVEIVAAPSLERSSARSRVGKGRCRRKRGSEGQRSREGRLQGAEEEEEEGQPHLVRALTALQVGARRPTRRARAYSPRDGLNGPRVSLTAGTSR